MKLRPHEVKMLAMLAEGAKTAEIAAALAFTDGTVRVYLHHLYKKIGVRDRLGAALWQTRRNERARERAARRKGRRK